MRDVELTGRELRRFERKAAWHFTHQAGRRDRCRKVWCFTCWRDQFLGRHRRERARMRAFAAASKARTDACHHEWVDKEIVGRIMPHCDLCGTTRWVRA